MNAMIDSKARQLINEFQGGFPVTPHPFADIGGMLDMTEASVISTIKSLRDAGILTRFGPLFDAAQIGGAFTLAAAQVPDDLFESVARVVNSFTEVAHNYRRDHCLNMWFVIGCDKTENIEKTLRKIENRTGLTIYNFPKIQEFYIGLQLKLGANGEVTTKPVSVTVPHAAIDSQIDAFDRRVIKATQTGLPLVVSPYAAIAKQISSTENEVMKALSKMQKTGVIRRIGVVPNHYKLGLRANGMSVWNVADAQIKTLGENIGALDFVSHAYERPRHLPLWPYNLFAMVHGKNRNEVKQKASVIADILGDACSQHEILFSSAILKKTGLRLVA